MWYTYIVRVLKNLFGKYRMEKNRIYSGASRSARDIVLIDCVTDQYREDWNDIDERRTEHKLTGRQNELTSPRGEDGSRGATAGALSLEWASRRSFFVERSSSSPMPMNRALCRMRAGSSLHIVAYTLRVHSETHTYTHKTKHFAAKSTEQRAFHYTGHGHKYVQSTVH